MRKNTKLVSQAQEKYDEYIELPLSFDKDSISSQRLIESNENQTKLKESILEQLQKSTNPIEQPIDKLTRKEKIVSGIAYLTVLICFSQFYLNASNTICQLSLMSSVLTAGVLLRKLIAPRNPSNSLDNNMTIVSLAGSCCLTTTAFILGVSTHTATAVLLVACTLLVSAEIFPDLSQKMIRRGSIWSGLAASVLALITSSRYYFQQAPMIGFFNSVGLDMGLDNLISLASVSTAILVFVMVFTKCKSIRTALLVLMTVSLASSGFIGYKMVQRNVIVNQQLRSETNAVRVTSSIHASFFQSNCGNKYIIDKTSDIVENWEAKQPSNSWVNPECRVPAISFYSAILVRIESIVLASIGFGAAFVGFQVLSEKSSSVVPSFKGKLLYVSLALLISTIITLISRFSTENLINPSFASFANSPLVSSRSDFGLVSSIGGSFSIEGSFKLHSCEEEGLMFISNYGTKQETHYRVQKDCKFSVKQLGSSKFVAFVFKNIKNVIDISSMVLVNPASRTLRLDNLPVPSALNEKIKISFEVEDLITGKPVEKFIVTVTPSSKGAEVLQKEATAGQAEVEFEPLFCSIDLHSQDHHQTKIQMSDIDLNKKNKVYLTPKTFSSQVLQVNSLADSQQSVSSRVTVDGKTCVVSEENPICPSAQYFKKTSADGEKVHSFIVIRSDQTKISDLAVESHFRKRSKGQKKLHHSARILEQSEQVILNTFVDDIGGPNMVMKISPERKNSDVASADYTEKQKEKYENPLSTSGSIIDSPSAFASFIASMSQSSSGESTLAPLEDGPIAYDDQGMFPYKKDEQKVKAISFDGDNGAVWYAIKYNDVKFFVITGPKSEKVPSSIYIPGEYNVQIIDNGDLVYSSLKDAWITVVAKDAKYFNINNDLGDKIKALKRTKVEKIPRVDILSHDAFSLNQNISPDVLSDTILEVIEGEEVDRVFELLDKEGEELTGSVSSSKMGYRIFSINTHLTRGSQSDYRVCVYCLFFEIQKKERLQTYFNPNLVDRKAHWSFIPDKIQVIFNNLYHYTPSVTFIDSEHHRKNSVFVKLGQEKYLEFSREELKKIYTLDSQGSLSNEWFTTVLSSEFFKIPRAQTVILIDNTLTVLNVEVIREYIEGNSAEIEPMVARSKIGKRLDVLTPYLSGVEASQRYMNLLFEKYPTQGGMLFIRDSKEIPYNMRTYPYILRREDSVVVKYLLNVPELRALVDKGPAPFTGIDNPANKIIHDDLVQHNEFDFHYTPLPEGNAEYLATKPVFGSETLRFSGECVQTLYNLKTLDFFGTYENRYINKLTKAEREVWVDKRFRVLNTDIVFTKFTSKIYSSDEEKSAIEDCYGSGTQQEAEVEDEEFVSIIHIKDKIWIKGICSSDVQDNTCKGTFQATDGIVSCEGEHPDTNMDQFNECKIVAGRRFGTCRGILNGEKCKGEYTLRNILIGQEFYNYHAEDVEYDYTIVRGSSMFKWDNPKRSAEEEQVTISILCDESVNPLDINTCKNAHYVYFDVQDDNGKPGMEYRQDIICQSARFEFEDKKCLEGGYLMYECHGRPSFEFLPESYVCLGNYTQLECVKGGKNETCAVDTETDRKESDCLESYFKAGQCYKDKSPSNSAINIEFSGYTFITDSYGKIIQVANFDVDSFKIGYTVVDSLHVKHTISRLLKLRSADQEPNQDLSKISFPYTSAKVSFDEGVLEKITFNNFRMNDFDYMKIATEAGDESSFVNLIIKEVIIDEVYLKGLKSSDGVVQEVAINTFNGEGNKKAVIRNYGYESIDSNLAFGTVYLRDANIMLPYISKAQLNEWEGVNTETYKPVIKVPETAKTADLKDYKIKVIEVGKRYSIQFPHFTLTNQNLDLLFVKDLVLSNSKLTYDEEIVNPTLIDYVPDPRFAELQPEVKDLEPISLTGSELAEARETQKSFKTDFSDL